MFLRHSFFPAKLMKNRPEQEGVCQTVRLG